jgi:hypothetical protein
MSAVKEHLKYIAAGAEMASRRARALTSVPPWKTAAVDELEDAELELERALQKVREAMREYQTKEVA